MNKEQAVTYLKFSGFSDEQIKAIEGAFTCDKCVYSTSEGCQYDDITETIPPFEDCISRQAVLDVTWEEPSYTDALNVLTEVRDKVKALPPVNSQKSNKWIPVSERLPEDGELVLFSTKTDRVFEGRYFADNTNRQWYAFRDECFAWNNVVIAWMPLPEPYKAESEGE